MAKEEGKKDLKDFEHKKDAKETGLEMEIARGRRGEGWREVERE